jgi:predicted branched-subunit amino acid permease
MVDIQLKEGVKAALPIVLGYLPVGMAFGVLARQAGLSPLESGSMSLLVYAGASQFIAVEMISKGVPWVPIVLTTFFINHAFPPLSRGFPSNPRSFIRSTNGRILCRCDGGSF